MTSNGDAVPDHAARRAGARGRALGAAGLLAAGGAGALLAGFATSASATSTVTVDSSADGVADATHCTDGTPGNCTLRDAAAAAVDGDTITFAPPVTAITLTAGRITFPAVTLTGPGSSDLTITSSGAPGAYNMFRFTGTGDVVISGMSLVNNGIKFIPSGDVRVSDVSISGSQAQYGGALYASNGGDLEIVDSRFDGNSATSKGGAVYAYNDGSVTISGSSFTNNDASGNGGALFTSAYVTGSITVTDSLFSFNATSESGGGAMFYSDGTADLVMDGTTFQHNTADSWGGAFYVKSPIVDVTITNGVMSLNSASSGSAVAYINNSGDLTISNSSFEDNTVTYGGSGAIYVSSGGNATITGSLFSGNSAVYGGGAVANGIDGVLTINNSTFTGNTGSYGGAIFSSAAMVLNQCTISANTATYPVGGGGVTIQSSASLTLSGTIVAGNSASVSALADIALDQAQAQPATIASDNSLLGAVDARITVTGSGNVSSTDPGLDPLADNGGPTRTMALQADSAAVDAGPDPVATFVGNGFDQRGTPFLRVSDGRADIGAFEVQVAPAPTTTAGGGAVVPTFTG